MNSIDFKIFKNLYNDDIIYHYTKASTAIDFILHNNELRFNKARDSNDPIESRSARRSTVYYGAESLRRQDNNYAKDCDDLDRFASDIESQFCQICFCQNSMSEDFAGENLISKFEGHEEIFGFTKLRMWDQYADTYTGVCIAFSKQKILSLNKSNLELIYDIVKYRTFQELWEAKLGNIQGNHLLNIGKKKYKEQIKNTIIQSFFYKHVDYLGENEYRIGTMFNEDKCSVSKHKGELIFNESIMLDISGCVEAIFISSYANDRQKGDLLEYANGFNIPIIEMEWQHDSFDPIDYRRRIQSHRTTEKEK